MGRAASKRIRSIIAADNSSRSSFKANQRLGRQLQRTPSEKYPVIGGPSCSHGFKYKNANGVEFVDPDHNCRDYENAKRAARGAPPLET